MIYFVVPLKSKNASNDWNKTCVIFERTLRSICNQIDSNYKVIIVCNDKPNIKFNSRKCLYKIVKVRKTGKNHYLRNMDREFKVREGLKLIKNKDDFVMVVDADDMISNKISKFVNSNKFSEGWFIKKGYNYWEKCPVLFLMRKGFDRYCGTSIITKRKNYDIPKKNNVLDYQYKYLRHREIVETLSKRGITLLALPFPSAIYYRGYGDNNYLNYSNKRSKSFIVYLLNIKSFITDTRFISKKVKKEFGFYKI